MGLALQTNSCLTSLNLESTSRRYALRPHMRLGAVACCARARLRGHAWEWAAAGDPRPGIRCGRPASQACCCGLAEAATGGARGRCCAV